MRRRVVARVMLLGVLLLMAGLPLAAQGLLVEYLDGTAQVKTQQGWAEVSPGDELAAQATLRVPAGAYLELSQGKLKIVISQAGSYLVKDLLGASRQVASWQLGSLVTDKIRTVVSGDRKEDTAVMGVRGEAAGPPADVEWIELGENDQSLQAGRRSLEQGRYAEALESFSQGLAASYGQERDVFAYYVAYVDTLQGRNAAALKGLEDVSPDPGNPVYADLLLLKGRLLIESLAFDQALQMFDAQMRGNPGEDLAQGLLLLSSFCYRGLGQPEQARSALQRAMALNPGSELAREADRLLKQL